MIFKLNSLPSRGWKTDLPEEFEVDPFGGKQTRLIAQAIEEKTMLPMVEALSQVAAIDIGQLSVPDFYYILLQLRFSMKAPLLTAWTCNNPMYEYTDGSYTTIQEDRSLITVRPCAHQTLTQLVRESFTITHLDDPDTRFDLPRVANFEKVHASMFDWIAAHLMPNHHRAIATLEEQSDLTLWQELVAWSKTSQHGIVRTIGCNCDGCGRTSPLNYELTAEIFL